MNTDNEPYEYCLKVSGPMFEAPEVVKEGLRPGRHFFETIDQLWYFFAELQIMRHKLRAGDLCWQASEGKHVRFHTVARLLFFHNFKTYQVDYDLDYLAEDEERCAMQFKNGSLRCDCVRSAILHKYNPDVECIPCGRKIELLKIELLTLKYENQSTIS